MSSNDLITNETLDNCPICLDTMNNNNHIVTSCGHHFHASCLIKNILLSHKSCPCCRKSLEEDAPNNVLANVVDRQHTFDVILDNIFRLNRHNFVYFIDRMYNYNIYRYWNYLYITNEYKLVSFLKKNVSITEFEDIYVSHIRRNLIVLLNEPYFTIDNCNLIAQYVMYKTEVMCEKYWKQQCSQYWSEYYIHFGKIVILGSAVLTTFIGLR
jgi:hypothetical protein